MLVQMRIFITILYCRIFNYFCLWKFQNMNMLEWYSIRKYFIYLRMSCSRLFCLGSMYIKKSRHNGTNFKQWIAELLYLVEKFKSSTKVLQLRKIILGYSIHIIIQFVTILPTPVRQNYVNLKYLFFWYSV